MPTGCRTEAHGALAIEVCIAWPGRAWRVAVRLPAGATIGDALRSAARDPAADACAVELLTAAATAPRRPPRGASTDAAGCTSSQAGCAHEAGPIGTGVFGRLRPLDWPLREGDRVEVYRPLKVDPKVARRRRAQARARAGRAGGIGQVG